MPKLVETPIGVVEFPDEMGEGDIQAVLDRNFGVSPPEAAESPGFLSLLGEELTAGAKTAAGPLGPVGLLQMVGAPGTAAGRTIGHRMLEATGSPVAAGVADAASSVALGGLAGAAGRGASKFARRVVAPRLPGAGTALREAGVETVEALPLKILPQMDSQTLFGMVGQQQGTVNVPKFRVAVEKLLDDQDQLAKFGRQRQGVVNQLETTLRTLEAGGDDISFQDLVKLRQDIGADIGALMRQGGPELGAQKLLFKSLSEDLDASTGPGATLLKEANRAFRKEAASEDLSEIVQKGINRPRQGTEFLDITYAGMLKQFREKVRKDDLFRGSFGKSELKEIDDTLTELSKIPLSPPPKGAMFGSGSLGRRGAISGAVGFALGVDPTVAALSGVAVSEAMSALLQTPTGRKVLVGIIRKSPRITAQSAGLLAAAARAISGTTAALE